MSWQNISQQNTSSNTSAAEAEDMGYYEQCQLYDFVVEAVLVGVLCLLGFGGNTLSIICLSKDRSKTATPFLLVSLEAADTFFLVTALLLRVLTSLSPYPAASARLQPLNPYLAKFVFPLALIAMTATIYLTILVTVNRYIAVCKPYQVADLCSAKHARKHVIIVVLFCILYNIPRFFERDFVMDIDNDTNLTYLTVEDSAMAKNNLYKIIYANVLYFLVMFLIPLILLIILNVKLIQALRETKRRRSLMQSSDHGAGSGAGSSRSEEDITLTLIVVVLVFLVTQTPALATQLLQTFLSPAAMKCPHPYFYYERVSDLFVVFNSAINFLIYCFCSRRFRQILFLLLCSNTRLARDARVSLLKRGSYKAVNGSSSLRGRSKSSTRSNGSSLKSTANAIANKNKCKPIKMNSIEGTLL